VDGPLVQPLRRPLVACVGLSGSLDGLTGKAQVGPYAVGQVPPNDTTQSGSILPTVDSWRRVTRVILFVVPLAAALLFAGCTSSPSSSSSPSKSARLAPAPSLPIAAECSIHLVTSVDGNVSSLLCPDGGVNVRAWRTYATNNLLVMVQPRGASEYQVVQAFCSDLAAGHTTLPIEQSAEELATHYNGWSFGGDSAATNPNCSE
jgi:hypothetical protein